MKIKKKNAYLATSLVVRIFESVADDRGKNLSKISSFEGKRKEG